MQEEEEEDMMRERVSEWVSDWVSEWAKLLYYSIMNLKHQLSFALVVVKANNRAEMELPAMPAMPCHAMPAMPAWTPS